MCNHRNNIPMMERQMDRMGHPTFPEGAAPQFAVPYQHVAANLEEVMREVIQNRARDAAARNRPEEPEPPPQRAQEHLLIPDRIAILPTGTRYHFWPNCQHFMRARTTEMSRVYNVCQTCVNMARRGYVVHGLEVVHLPPQRRRTPQEAIDHQMEQNLLVDLDNEWPPLAIEENRVN